LANDRATMTATIRRFYKSVTVALANGGFSVVLDGRPLRTPAGATLVLPSEQLAHAVADEWRSQGDVVHVHVMPLTQLANTMIDRVHSARSAIIAEVTRYAVSDLLCYWATGPRDLVDRQRAIWQPLLDWASATFGARLAVTAGVVPAAQPAKAVAALGAAIAGLDDVTLVALATVTAATGSLILALALAFGRIDADGACRAAHLDEAWQNESWGEDAEAAQRRKAISAEIHAAARFMTLARS
jgi:chaperone required for assembly of F1-ATPase